MEGCPLRAAKKLNFGTTNGNILAKTAATSQCTELNREVEPYVLPSTPCVLSIGRRCVEDGCFSAWPAGKAPTMHAPSGRALELSVIKNIPYPAVGSPGDAQLAMAGAPMAPSVVVEGLGDSEATTVCGTPAPPGIFLDASASSRIFPDESMLTLGEDTAIACDAAAPGHVDAGADNGAELGTPMPDPVDVEAGIPLHGDRRRCDVFAEAEGRLHKLAHLPKSSRCETRAHFFQGGKVEQAIPKERPAPAPAYGGRKGRGGGKKAGREEEGSKREQALRARRP